MRSLSSEQLLCYSNGKVLRGFFFVFFYKQTVSWSIFRKIFVLTDTNDFFLILSKISLKCQEASSSRNMQFWPGLAPVHKVRRGSGVAHWTKSESCNAISQTYDVFEKKNQFCTVKSLTDLKHVLQRFLSCMGSWTAWDLCRIWETMSDLM